MFQRSRQHSSYKYFVSSHIKLVWKVAKMYDALISLIKVITPINFLINSWNKSILDKSSFENYWTLSCFRIISVLFFIDLLRVHYNDESFFFLLYCLKGSSLKDNIKTSFLLRFQNFQIYHSNVWLNLSIKIICIQSHLNLLYVNKIDHLKKLIPAFRIELTLLSP